MKKYFRAAYYFGIILLFLTVVVVGFTQTRAFRAYLRSVILTDYPLYINGTLEIGGLEGNLLTGFEIRGLKLSSNEGPVLTAERAEVRYDPLGFILNKVGLRVTLVHPSVSLWRSNNGVWNFSHIIKPRPSDSSASQTVLDIKNLQLVGAQVRIVDSLALSERALDTLAEPLPSQVDYANIQLDSLNLTAVGRIDPQKISFEIRKLSWQLSRPQLKLVSLSGEFNVTPKNVTVRNLSIEMPRSKLKLDASLGNTDIKHIRSVRDLEKAPVSVNLEANRIDTREVKQFLYPFLDFLDQEISLQIKLGGTFDRLNVEKLEVRLSKSQLLLHGTVSRLYDPKDMELEVEGTDNTIDPEDALLHLPGLKIPDLRSIGSVRCNLAFAGHPTDFKAHFVGTADAGKVDVQGSLKIQGTLDYNVNIVTRNLDLAKIFVDENLKSSLNMAATLDGVGTNLQTMKSVARIELDSSEFRNIPVRNSVLVIDGSDGLFNAHGAVEAGDSRFDLSGKAQFYHADSTEWSVSGKIASLNLAEILQDSLRASEITMTVDAHGVLFQPLGSETDATLAFLPSKYNDEEFDQDTVRVVYNARDDLNRHLWINSGVGEILVDGRFSPASLVSSFRYGGETISKAIAYRFKTLDSLRALSPSSKSVAKFQVTANAPAQSVDARFAFIARDLYPLGLFLKESLEGSGEARGTVIANGEDLALNGEASVSTFLYESQGVSVRLQNAGVRWDAKGISRTTIFQTIQASVDAQGDEAQLNSTRMTDLEAHLEILGDSTRIRLSSLVDSLVQIDIKGMARYSPFVYSIRLDTLSVSLGSNTYANTEPVILSYGADGLRVQDLWLHREAEELMIAGYFDPSGRSDLESTVKGLLLTNIELALEQRGHAEFLSGIGGLLSGKMAFHGDFGDPALALDCTVDGFRRQQMVLGQMESRISYSNHLLDIFVGYRNRPQEAAAPPDLVLSGTLPFELALTAAHHHKPQGQINLILRSKGVRLENTIGPFVPIFTNLAGYLVCDMKMSGTTDAPLYNGVIAVSGATFLFKPLNMPFTMDGKFVSDGNTIALDNVVVRNIPDDQKFGEGVMNLSGDFKLEGLNLGEFDLTANGELLVMKESSRQVGQKLYGTLYGATGPQGVHWTGTMAQSSLTGIVYIKNANLVLPPERETSVNVKRDISIVAIDDTSRTLPAQDSKHGHEGLGPGRLLASNTTSDGTYTNGDERPEGSFLDNIRYDLFIETHGPTLLRFVFNPITNEELYADLRGRLSFSKTGPQSRLTGEVEVGNRSYYEYIKKFDATGKLRFTGDPLNPELDIAATYEGVHYITSSGADTSLPAQEKVIVTLNITGTRSEPKLSMDLQVEHRDASGVRRLTSWSQGDVESNAIAFLLSGKFRDELTSQQRVDLLGNNLIGLTSGVLSAPLREYLRRETGVSVDVLYYGGAFDQTADVRLTGEVGAAVVRFGGRVFNNINNSNVSVELPLNSVLGSETWRNLILTLERRVEGLENFDESRSASTGARLLYRITF